MRSGRCFAPHPPGVPPHRRRHSPAGRDRPGAFLLHHGEGGGQVDRGGGLPDATLLVRDGEDTANPGPPFPETQRYLVHGGPGAKVEIMHASASVHNTVSTESVDAPLQQGARLRRTGQVREGAQRSRADAAAVECDRIIEAPSRSAFAACIQMEFVEEPMDDGAKRSRPPR